MTTSAPVPGRESPEAGFTLIEMLIVLAIMAVVAAIAAPGIVQRYWSESLDTSSSEIVARFRTARTLAIATARPQRIVIDTDRRTVRFDDQHVLNLPQDVKLTVTTGRETVKDGRRAVLTFLADGSASGLEIDLQRGEQAAHIEVNWLTGLASLQVKP